MRVSGEIIVPGDKSITHRALLLSGLMPGTSEIRGALTSLDARSTTRVLRALGVEVSPLKATVTTVRGRRRWTAPETSLNCGNSGTTARLSLGILAAQRFSATLTGDQSLRRRPMARVTEPLSAMGARFSGKTPERLPLTVRGGKLESIRWELPVSSAQIKSAVILAGLMGQVPVAVREPGGKSRDHTERLLAALGCRLRDRNGWIEFEPAPLPRSLSYDIPGDPSSAAFLVGTAVLAESGQLAIRHVGLNPTRVGFLKVLERMGAKPAIENERVVVGEPVGDLVAGPASLHAATVEPAEIPALIDEIPLLAVLAARARGVSRFEEVGELRVKESDRLSLLAENLRAVGVRAEAQENTLLVEGTDRPPRGRVHTEGDHRIAMAFAVLGTVPGASVRIDDRACAAVSFPGFDEVLARVGRGRGRR
jgi:3-phosphoshikimate 1-carboxyvinyltransferase